MASTTFVDGSTIVMAAWLNDVNNAVYNGITPPGYVLGIQYGGTGATTDAAARANLGVEIGVDVQSHSTILDSIDDLSGYGLMVHNNVGNVLTRTIVGTTNKILVSNDDGVGGNPTINVGSDVYQVGGTDVALADGGTGASLTDPNDDRMMFWDDSAGSMAWLTPGTNLSITGTTLNATGGGGGGTPSGNIGSIQYNFDNTDFGGDNGFTTDGFGNTTMLTATIGNTIIQNSTITTNGGNDLVLTSDGAQAIQILKNINASGVEANIGGMSYSSTGVFLNSNLTYQVAFTDVSGTLEVLPAQGGAPSGSITLYEEFDSGTNKIQLRAPTTLASDSVLTLQGVTGTVYSSGGTDIPVTDGGTGASTTSAARTNLGVAIGTDVQAFSAQLTSAASVGDGIVAHTAANTFTPRTITGTTNLITVTNGTGVSGNPTITVGSNVYQTGGTDVAVADGGTGVSTMTTAYAPVCAGTTATGALQVASTGISTAGFVLTSTGASSLPTFQSPTGGTGIIQRNSFTSSGTWTKTISPVPGTNSMTLVQIWGSGGSGGSSAAGFAGGGGGGGCYTEFWFLTSTLSATETITIGAAAGVTGTTAGNTGGNTTFGTKLTGFGGGGGCSTSTATGAGGGGGASNLSSGTPGAISQGIGRDAGTAGGTGAAVSTSASGSGFGGGGGGGSGTAAGLGGSAIYGGGGGGGGGGNISATGGGAGGTSIYAGGGGGGASNLGTGGSGGPSTRGGAGGAGGTGAGAPAAGTQPGGGGGGSMNQTSGAGGSGTIIVTVFG